MLFWKRNKKSTSTQSHEVVFKEFRASPKPAGPPPVCIVCGTVLKWKPRRYSFGQGGFLFIVPEMGGWRCPKGHPGQVYRPDFERYAQLVEDYLATRSQ